jgi:hypothetical protein
MHASMRAWLLNSQLWVKWWKKEKKKERERERERERKRERERESGIPFELLLAMKSKETESHHAIFFGNEKAAVNLCRIFNHDDSRL